MGYESKTLLDSSLDSDLCQALPCDSSPAVSDVGLPVRWSCNYPHKSGCPRFRRYGGSSRYEGELCGGCPWTLIYPFVAGSPTKRLRFRRNIAYVRLSKGMAVEHLAGNRLITWTVGESRESVSVGVDFGRAVNQFMAEFRRKHGRKLSYAWVEHKPKAGTSYLDKQGQFRVSEGHYNRHFVVSGSGKVDYKWLDGVCMRLFKSHESKLSEVKSRHGYGFYLADYVSKDNEEFVRVRFSDNWVFPGWVTVDRAFKADVGRYLEVDELVDLKRDEALLAQFVSELLSRGRFVCASGLRRDLKSVARRLRVGFEAVSLEVG